MIIPKGKLIAVGGAEDKGALDESDYSSSANLNFFELGIIGRFAAELNKDNPRIEVIPTASLIPVEVGKVYLEAFEKAGYTNVGVMDIRNREEALDEKYTARIKKADGVFFTGGNQLRLSSIFGGTEIHRTLRDRYIEEENFVIAGTSAGAMAMSNTMIREGSSSNALKKGAVKITTGFGFINDVIIDSHFVKRGRFGRLTEAVVMNPLCLGIGLGEDTGVLITEGHKLEAIGSGLVILMDGLKIKHTSISDLPDGTPISVNNMIVHVMAKSDVYNLTTKEFTPAIWVDEEAVVDEG